MRDVTFGFLLNEVGDLLDELKRDAPHARSNLANWAGLGYSPGGEAGGGHGGGGTSDPTAQVAIAAMGRDNRDRFEANQRELVYNVRTAVSALRRARQITHDAVTPVEGFEDVAGCSVCGRAFQPTIGTRVGQTQLGHQCSKECRDRDHRHPNAWQPIYTRIQRPASEPDSPKVPYCSFCADFITRYGVEPARAITLWHLDHLGSRVQHTLIREHHPTEFARHHDNRRVKA